MKPSLAVFLLFILTFPSGLIAQSAQYPEQAMQESDVKSQLYFLASDFLKGRRTGMEGNNIAARYIATQLQAAGFQPAPGQDSYFQTIAFQANQPPAEAALTINDTEYEHLKDFLVLSGAAASISKAKGVFAGHGWVDSESGRDDYKGLDVKGKVVFVFPGTAETNTNQEVFAAMSKKRALAEERGAAGLIELYNLSFPWNFFLQYFGRESLGIGSDEDADVGKNIVYGFLRPNPDVTDVKDLQEGSKVDVNLNSSGFISRPMPSQNVVGVLEGSDPELKDEYVLLSAHYDHVGVGKQGGGAFSPADSIFNGARDNGMGVIALLQTAKALGIQKPKRSVIILACTAEEVGLLGSKYYAEHPLVPLNKTVFNLNTDGAGYNTTSAITILGFGRTGTDDQINAAAETFGLSVIADPAPEQNLFDRSDNVSFAAKGVPALTLSPGFSAFDEEISKYYHQVSDNPESVDYAYATKYCQAFAHLARLVADKKERPVWKAGDKYENAGKELYSDK